MCRAVSLRLAAVLTAVPRQSELESADRLRSELERLSAALESRDRQLAQLSDTVTEREESVRRATATAAAAGDRTHTNKSVPVYPVGSGGGGLVVGWGISRARKFIIFRCILINIMIPITQSVKH